MNILNSQNLIHTSIAMGHYKAPNTIKNLSTYLHKNTTHPWLILCIGTDRCIGDSLGPLVGTILKKSNPTSPIYGTLENPIHALNLTSSIREIRKDHRDFFVIAIDASLGNEDSIGNIIIREGPLYPGKGVGKELPAIGDLSIVGIVEDMHCNISTTINHIRLSFVMSMAETITQILAKGLGLNKP